MKGKRKVQSAKRKAAVQSLRFLVLSFSFALYVLSFAFTCYAASLRPDLKAANKLYEKGRFDEALQKYNEASVAMPDSDIINFNMGTALYKKANYEKAIDAFVKALISDNKTTEADALYNLGNCKYKSGKLKENTDLSATVGFLRESLDHYKRAVEIDQKNTDARFNHEFVERELKVLLDKLKQRTENREQKTEDKEKEEQQQQEQQKQAACPAGSKQGNDEQRAKGIEQSKEEEQRAKSKEQRDEEGRQKEERQSDREEPSQEEGENKELSEQGARAVLERYGKEEASPDYLSMGRHNKGYDREVLKDW